MRYFFSAHPGILLAALLLMVLAASGRVAACEPMPTSGQAEASNTSRIYIALHEARYSDLCCGAHRSTLQGAPKKEIGNSGRTGQYGFRPATVKSFSGASGSSRGVE